MCQPVPTYESSKDYLRHPVHRGSYPPSGRHSTAKKHPMNQYAIKTHDNDEIPLELFIEAPDKETAIAKVRELGYFPESFRQLNGPQAKPKMNPAKIALFVVMIIIQLGFMIWHWTK